MMRRALIAVGLTILLVGLSEATKLKLTDCIEPGRFALRQADSILASGALRVEGWSPIFLSVHDTLTDDCEYVSAWSVYRLVYDDSTSGLVAGCYGDFDGDGSRDYAMLLQRKDRSVLPFVFMYRAGRYREHALPPVFDHYGFDEDPSHPPGPFCYARPP